MYSQTFSKITTNIFWFSSKSCSKGTPFEGTQVLQSTGIHAVTFLDRFVVNMLRYRIDSERLPNVHPCIGFALIVPVQNNVKRTSFGPFSLCVCTPCTFVRVLVHNTGTPVLLPSSGEMCVHTAFTGAGPNWSKILGWSALFIQHAGRCGAAWNHASTARYRRYCRPLTRICDTLYFNHIPTDDKFCTY